MFVRMNTASEWFNLISAFCVQATQDVQGVQDALYKETTAMNDASDS